jgi:solute carrier family 12 (potassium/chloride transporters), member 9
MSGAPNGDWYHSTGRPPNKRGRPTFLTRTATDEAAQLLRRSSDPSAPQLSAPSEVQTTRTAITGAPVQPAAEATIPAPRPAFATQIVDLLTDGTADDGKPTTLSGTATPDQQSKNDSLAAHLHIHGPDDAAQPQSKSEANIAQPSGPQKLDTLSGVFIPVSLNVLSILMFIRFGFILGQGGLIGILGMLLAAYLINLITTLSISAIASNGTVRGGGAYYLISRSLGPEFGGAIGVISYMGYVFNTGLNAAGLIDCLIYNFGSQSGNWANILPEGGWWQYLWSTVVVILCTGICLAGSSMFARVSNGLLLILLVATFSIPFSALILSPFQDNKQYVHFTGLSVQTLRENMFPHFTKGAAGSQIKGHENFQDLFGILFPATCGILAGASMSGDLKNPSKSIPRGTLGGMGLTFVAYTLVILSLAASITRESFLRNVNVVQDANLSGILILAGELASTFFSTLMGIIGPAKQLQAIASDNVIPGLSALGLAATTGGEPTRPIFITFVAAQLVLLLDINQIASLITMAYLMTFFALNVATFLLKIGSAPNFRPSFRYFNWYTAAVGAILSVVSMFFVDGLSASGSICILLLLIAVIHYTTPPKPWGSISEVLIYHQVRKYLLRLKTEHVKFWRPQILLFVNDPRRGYKLIQFCNSLKKGGLYILGHVIVTQNFAASVPEARKQQAAWTRYIDFSHIKAFVNVAISPSIEWGARNILLSAGLGSMRPNLVIFGVYNLQQFRSEQPLVDVPSPPPERKQDNKSIRRRKSPGQLPGELPTDVCVIEKRTDIQSYVMVLEDMILSLKTNLAIAAGFNDLELPSKDGNAKKYIDLWPIQMSAEISEELQNVKTTNFDTYTLILQLGCILNTVPSWKASYKLRVAVFVEYESDVDEERSRVASLLENLRIQGEVLVFWLASGHYKTYEYIVNGIDVDEEIEAQVDKVLEDEAWWKELAIVRGKVKSGDMSAADALSLADEVQWGSPGPRGSREASVVRMEGLRRLLTRPRKRSSFGNLSNAGISFSMRTSRIDDDMLSRHASHPSDSEYSDSDSEDEDEADDNYAIDESEETDDAVEGVSTKSSSRRSVSQKTKSKASSKKSSRASSRRSGQRHKRETSDDDHLKSSDLLIHFDEDILTAQSTRASKRGRSRRNSLDSTSPRTRPQTPEDGTSSARKSDEDPGTAAVPVGPSIQFVDTPHPKRQDKKASTEQNSHATATTNTSIYVRATSSSPSRPVVASGFPANGSLPLSFNTLPSRAQHLILNELMARDSEDTAVMFTTLPAPTEGTYKSETESLGYVSNLEVLYGGLPPTLLVHSNSMTVTTNL